MNAIFGPLTFFFQSSESKETKEKKIQFNRIVRSVEIPRNSPDLFYHKKDYIQFKNEAKTGNEEILEDENLIEPYEPRSANPIITNIFLRAISYLRQFFISDPFEEDLSSPLLSPQLKTEKNSIRSLDKNPWLLVSDPILSEEIPSLDPEDTRWILIRKSIINLVPEERIEFDNINVASNTAANETVTKLTTSIWKRLKKRKALRELEKNLEAV